MHVGLKGILAFVNWRKHTKGKWLLKRKKSTGGHFLVPASLKKVIALWIRSKRKEGTCLLNRRTSTGGFSSLNWRRLQKPLCFVNVGLVEASCAQEGSYCSIEGCMQLAITLWIKASMEIIICPINTGMHASNVQSKQSCRPPLHFESCEANGAVEACMQEVITSWIEGDTKDGSKEA